MLTAPSLSSARLCTSCRGDLLSLFRYGFCAQAGFGERTVERLKTLRGRNLRFRRQTTPQAQHVRWSSTRTPTEETVESADPEPEPTADQPALREEMQGEIVRKARETFGDALPAGVLEEAEYRLYTRLYGEPAEVIDEVEIESRGEADTGRDLLDNDGDVVQEVPDNDEFVNADEAGAENIITAAAPGQDVTFGDSKEDRMRDIAQQLGGEVYQNAEDSEEANETYEPIQNEHERQHPLTTLGKFAISPRTVFLPQEQFTMPVEVMLSKYSNKQLKEMCQRVFGGEDLPDSALTPYPTKTRQQIPIPLDASQHVMGEMEANTFVAAIMPPVYASVLSILTETRKRLGSSWLRDLITKEGGPRVLDTGAGGAGILAWNEIVKAEWASLNGKEAAAASPPPAAKAIVLTGSDTLRQRAAKLLENTTFIPRLPDIAHTRNTPTLDDSRPAQQRKQFDVIIAPHNLFPLKEDYLRKQHVQNLWSLLSPEGGVLILLEKGIPRGFEAVAGAREFLLERYISSPGSETYQSPVSNSLSEDDQITTKDAGMIIAPCTNHEKCPMYTVAGVSKGRKDFCAFKQKFVRPPFLHRIMGAGHFNDDRVGFSYLSVMKGRDLRNREISTWQELIDPLAMVADKPTSPSSPKALRQSALSGFELSTDYTALGSQAHRDATASEVATPLNTSTARLIFTPLKRTGHVSMDLCTPHGRIERWTVPRSFSKQAYRDARKARWGDLWTLGAKTAVPRNLQLGEPATMAGRKKEKKRRRVEEKLAEERERLEESALASRLEEEESEGVDRAFGEDALEEEFEMDEDEDEDEEEDIPRYSPSMKAGPGRKQVSDKKLRALMEQVEREDGDGAAAQQERLREMLRSDGDDIRVDAALKEWEAEYESDPRLKKGRNANVSLGVKGGRRRR